MKFFDMIFDKSKEFPWPEEHPLDKNITADAYAEAHNDSFGKYEISVFLVILYL